MFEKVQIFLNDDIQTRIAAIEDNTEIVFEKGEYYIDKTITIADKKNVIIKGYDCTFSAYYDQSNGGNTQIKSVNPFLIENCENITIEGLTVKNDKPAGMRGKIICDNASGTEVELFTKSSLHEDINFVCGWTLINEKHFGMMHDVLKAEERKVSDNRYVVFDEHVTTNAPFTTMNTEKTGENRYKFTGINPWHETRPDGIDCVVCCSYYGTTAFCFRNAKNILIKNVSITEFGGMGILILPRCENFTADNLVLSNPDKKYGHFSTYSDGIHILGLAGKFIIKNSLFDATQDDHINIHTVLNTAINVKKDSFNVIYNKKKGVVSKYWTKPGDTLYVYDRYTGEIKEEILVERYEDNTVYFNRGKINEGDYVANIVYFAEMLIENSRFVNGRGGIKVKSVNSGEIKNCIFENGAKAIDVQIAYNTLEAGPVKNLTIKNNIFKNMFNRNGTVINVGMQGKPGNEEYLPEKLHKNIKIKENVFENCGDYYVKAISTDGLELANNQFKECYDIKKDVTDCTNVTDTDNL